jgi:lipopolysaccharide transport system ATP-binding protein
MASVIEVKDLSKSFIISHEKQERYTALRDVLANNVKKMMSIGKKSDADKKITKEEFWALKDVSFNIEKGDRVGIIGRNGAGKSTLLKILSRITEPTAGEIKIRGRVASLLEVGTGFHPELTGRENVFLNGAILGMSRSEIKRKFDEIVDFAEVEQFLDTPVKRYSSGMYVRLAFAVAANLEPEILVVDEVLAVGDAQFQKKCLGKMEDVSKNEGRTVLFVSHNIDAISTLTNKGLLLSKGKMDFYGSTSDAIGKYMQQGSTEFVYKKLNSPKSIFFSEISTPPNGFIHNTAIEISMSIYSDRVENGVTLGVGIYNMFDQYVGNRNVENALDLVPGYNTFKVKIANHNLVPSDYKTVLALAKNKTYDMFDAVVGEPALAIFNDEQDELLLSRWMKQWGSHYLSDIKIEAQ